LSEPLIPPRLSLGDNTHAIVLSNRAGAYTALRILRLGFGAILEPDSRRSRVYPADEETGTPPAAAMSISIEALARDLLDSLG
jgi:hypothetical protein